MSARTRLALALSSAAPLLVLFAALPACETTKSVVGQDAATKAMSSLPQGVMNTAKDYIAKLGNVNSMLAGIRDNATALKTIPGLAEIVEPLNKLTDSLNALSPQLKEQARTAFGDQLDTVNTGFTNQSNRLSSMPDTGSLLKSTLDRVKLFK